MVYISSHVTPDDDELVSSAARRSAFGSMEKSPSRTVSKVDRAEKVYSILHGKDELILWDEFASSDDGDDRDVQLTWIIPSRRNQCLLVVLESRLIV